MGPIPITARIGRNLTEVHHGMLRSAFAGQGNALLLSPRLRVLEHRVLTLNSRRFRTAQAAALGLSAAARLVWAKERRVVHAARLAHADGRMFLVANLHCTSYRHDQRLADAELLRAAWFASSTRRSRETSWCSRETSTPGSASSPTLRDLTGPEWGFSPAGPGIDHILVRGAVATPLHVWPEAQRRHGVRLLSDHAPVELEIP